MDLKESISKLARRVKAPRSEIVRSEIVHSEIETREIKYPRTVEERDELYRRFMVQIESGNFRFTNDIFGDCMIRDDEKNFWPLFDGFKKSKKFKKLKKLSRSKEKTEEEWKMDIKDAWNQFWEEGGGKTWIEDNEGLAFLPVLRDL